MIQIQELSAIWLSKPVQIETKGIEIWTCRVKEGDLVSIKDGRISDDRSPSTHKIIGCYGTEDSSILEFAAMCLTTNQTTIINANKQV